MLLREMRRDLRPLMCSGRGSAGDKQRKRADRMRNCSARVWLSLELSLKVISATARSLVFCGGYAFNGARQTTLENYE